MTSYKIVLTNLFTLHINKVFLGTYDRMETAIHFYKNRGFNEVKALRQDEDARFFEMYI